MSAEALQCHICGSRIERVAGGGWYITQRGRAVPHACCFLEPIIANQLNGDLMRVYVDESSDVSARHEICKDCVREWLVKKTEPRCDSRAYLVSHQDEGQCCFCGQSVETVALTK